MTRESVRSLLVTNVKWFINSLTGSRPPLSCLRSSLRPFKCPRTIDGSTSRGKCRKYACRCQIGHLRRRDDRRGRGREQIKDRLNEMLSARICTWAKDSDIPTVHVRARKLSSINAFASNLRTPGLS